MKISTVKAGLNAFFSNLKIYLNRASSLTDLSLFIHTCKCYAYIKKSVLLSEESFVAFHLYLSNNLS